MTLIVNENHEKIQRYPIMILCNFLEYIMRVFVCTRQQRNSSSDYDERILTPFLLIVLLTFNKFNLKINPKSIAT